MFPMTSFPSRFVRTAGLLSALLAGAAAQATVIYSNLPTLAGNVDSWAYEATQTRELGDHVQFAGIERALNSVTITMSNWSKASSWDSVEDGFQHDVTFNIYNYATDAMAGSLIATKTINTLVPWRAEADNDKCTGADAGKWFSTVSGRCHNGVAFNVTFDFTGMGVILPDDIVFGVSSNTTNWGNAPLGGAGGPYDSLNYGLTSAAPSVGTDVDPQSLFLNTANPANLVSGTVNNFGADDGWSGDWYYVPIASFDASIPEPATLALFGLALVGLVTSRRRKV
jgi:hypothetical protein